jgi:hypothetical protein
MLMSTSTVVEGGSIVVDDLKECERRWNAD